MRRIVGLPIAVTCIALIVWFSAVPVLRSVLKLPNPVLPACSPESPSEALAHSQTPNGRISPWMQLAVLAAEDHRFYEHHGIDSLGIIRATLDNIKAGRMIEGASTITQQLAKITFLDQEEKTAQRKLSQPVLAWQLEEIYPKDKILEAYLNTIYFGRGAYGVEAAAQKYFGVHASRLSIAQSAFLAGVVRAPSVLGNPANRNDAITRQHQVIESMQDYEYISKRQAAAALQQPLLLTNPQAQ